MSDYILSDILGVIIVISMLFVLGLWCFKYGNAKALEFYITHWDQNAIDKRKDELKKGSS